MGAEDFVDRLADKLARGDQPGVRARERREIDRVMAERLIRAGLTEAAWQPADLKRRAKGDPIKVKIAGRLRPGNTDDAELDCTTFANGEHQLPFISSSTRR